MYRKSLLIALLFLGSVCCLFELACQQLHCGIIMGDGGAFWETNGRVEIISIPELLSLCWQIILCCLRLAIVTTWSSLNTRSMTIDVDLKIFQLHKVGRGVELLCSVKHRLHNMFQMGPPNRGAVLSHAVTIGV